MIEQHNTSRVCYRIIEQKKRFVRKIRIDDQKGGSVNIDEYQRRRAYCKFSEKGRWKKCIKNMGFKASSRIEANQGRRQSTEMIPILEKNLGQEENSYTHLPAGSQSCSRVAALRDSQEEGIKQLLLSQYT